MLVLALCLVAAAGFDDSSPQRVELTLLPKGAAEKAGYIAQGLGITLGPTRPESIKKVPDGLKAPKYGVARFGDFTLLRGDGEVMPKPEGAPAPAGPEFAVILDEPEGAASTLYIDTNRDGDLSNDAKPDWTAHDGKAWDGSDLKTYTGNAAFNLGTAESPRVVNLGLYRFDPKDPQRQALAPYLVAFRDYAATGEVKLGDKTYRVMLSEDRGTGDFRGRSPEAKKDEPKDSEKKDADKKDEQADEQVPNLFESGVTLVIDVNANGRTDEQGEVYDARKPFNIGGITYELADIKPDGTGFTVVKSSTTVAEIKPPPDHRVGQKITSFEATRLDGTKVKFPDDYKGKVVMIDFWATWCGPCMMEVPNVVDAYTKLHDKGFDVLGVTLDNAGAKEKLDQVMKDKGMTWPQIYEGKGWRTSLASLYFVRGIPACWLVDGDTGMIVADESSMRGPQLSGTVEKALADKKK